MNDNAFKLKLTDTQYDSPHGLMNRNNFSSAYDICTLANECIQLDEFRKVVQTPYYETRAVRN